MENAKPEGSEAIEYPEGEVFPNANHPDDPSGDVPERQALGVFVFPEDDDVVLAESTEQAVEIWREYHGHADCENPERIDTLCNPLDLIQMGDVEEINPE